MPKFNVTYEIITPESAEYGDAAERGFVAKDVSLREAVDLIGGTASEANSWPLSREYPPRWFTHDGYGADYSTGAEESRSLHLPDNITPSSAMRVARLLGFNV